MAEVIKGLGVVWSTDALAVSGTGVFATGKIQSIRYNFGGDVAEIKGDNGEVKAVVFSNDIENITIEVVPTGSSVANANSSFVLPARGADVAITDSADGEINSTTFMFIDGDKNRTVDGAATLTMNLRRYGGATLSTVS